ncbi:hypothetical protein NTGBS_440020 [Candidatus Nitrotoga sp. BS]|nr:hypothetical protein NTGBS_440020 [Candidatus Nitrotoga sp. BS]
MPECTGSPLGCSGLTHHTLTIGTDIIDFNSTKPYCKLPLTDSLFVRISGNSGPFY